MFLYFVLVLIAVYIGASWHIHLRVCLRDREMGRSPCCSKEGMNRGAWTSFEDNTLKDYIKLHGEGNWRNLPKRAGLKRCGKSCRLRWMNYLRPDIKRGNITSDEEDLIIRLHKLLGNRWSLIAGRLPGRTDNEIKNYWNTNITKKLKINQSFTPNPKLPRNTSKHSLSPTIPKSIFLPPAPGKQSHAIRTKASRCTRILYDQYADMGSPAFNQEQPNEDVVISPELDNKGSRFIWKNPEPSDFLMDFDLDDNFLSDFFINTEILETKASSSSPDSDQNILLPSEMTGFLDCNLDWPQDQSDQFCSAYVNY